MGKEEGEAAVLFGGKCSNIGKGWWWGRGEGGMFRALETTNLQVFFRARGIDLGESLDRGLGDPP